jgi:glutathione S-transferase
MFLSVSSVAKEETMQLYWAPKTCAFNAVWMIEETGLPYELIKMDWKAGALKTDAYRAINPMMKMPALELAG